MEHELTDVMALLAEVAERVESLEAAAPELGGDAVAGSTPEAEENRAIAAARAGLAKERAWEMRAGLDRIREQARRMAELARVASPSGGRRPQAVDGAGGVDVVRALAEAETDADVLAAVIAGAVDAVGGAGRAGVVRGRRDGTITCESPGDPTVERLVAWHEAEGAGPIWDVLEGAGVLRVRDLCSDPRWRGLQPLARSMDVRGVVVHTIRARPFPCALVVCTTDEAVPDDADARRLGTLAEHAAIAFAGTRRAEALRRTLGNQELIGQAKGALMQRDGLDADQAEAKLVEASRHSDTALHDVARWLMDDTGGRRRDG